MDQLTEQRENYRHRAAEYDERWQRRGRHAVKRYWQPDEP